MVTWLTVVGSSWCMASVVLALFLGQFIQSKT